MLTVNVQSAPPVVTLTCEGRLVLGVEAETLRCLATSRTEEQVVLDLQDVNVMDAAGLGLLVELHCWILQRSGLLTIANPSLRVRRMMALTNLESVLDVEELTDEETLRAERRAMTA